MGVGGLVVSLVPAALRADDYGVPPLTITTRRELMLGMWMLEPARGRLVGLDSHADTEGIDEGSVKGIFRRCRSSAPGDFPVSVGTGEDGRGLKRTRQCLPSFINEVYV